MNTLLHAIDTFPFRRLVSAFALLGFMAAAWLIGLGAWHMAHASVAEDQPIVPIHFHAQEPVPLDYSFCVTPSDRALAAAWSLARLCR